MVSEGCSPELRGPFTPSQWMVLEHQALIYKYITVVALIPSNLLVPIRKALETAAFCYPGANLRHTARRCRRTDGKKWRCSRDAMADQKYCERHMNRGRNGGAREEVVSTPTATAPTGISHLSQQNQHQFGR
ncbi:putative transcription factor interactor and regulator C3H-WRC/GRF family [Helianthus debilis subsp. tardiflorus]